MVAQIIIQLVVNIQNSSLIYYCNWVLGTYTDGVTQTIVSAIGNAPLGFGILIMWPLVGKFGKRNVMVTGLALAIVAGLAFCINPTSMSWVLIMLVIRAFGALPITYICMAMLADALDHVEWKAGFRCDGFSMSVYTIIFTVAAAAAEGRVWLSPEEQAAIEQAEQEKVAEAKRIEELKAKCAKKGLNFDEEEAKYQAKLAAAKAKAEAKANKRKK